MNYLDIIPIVLILLGAGIIIIAAYLTCSLIKILPTKRDIKNWKILGALMILFTFGYFGAAYMFFLGFHEIILVITGGIFFFGALFVLLTVYTGKKTIKDLLNISVSKSYVESIIKSMADTLLVINIDRNATIKLVNNAALNLLKYKENDLVGNSVKMIVESKVLDQIKLDTLVDLENLADIETIYHSKDGENIPVSFSASMLRNLKGEIEGIIYVAKDIRERKETERKIRQYVGQLKESQKQLKELNASKDKFFSIIAHDLRNPFAGVLGYSEILANDSAEMSKDELVEFSGNLYQQAKTIYDLLENLLSWSRIQTGKMPFEPKNIELNKHICDVLVLYESVAGTKNISLYCDQEKIINVYADKDMMFTVLRNLISNALKFTKEYGSVEVLVKEKNNDFIETSVKDSGIGMTDEDMEKLFKIDVHFSQKGTSNEEGTGLGLILCNELITKNGGEIWVESILGRGTTFKFTLPKSSSKILKI